MIYGPIRWQILILLDSSTIEIIIVNVVLAVEFYNKGLVKAHSKLKVESICKV